jgi:hypothetical protein
MQVGYHHRLLNLCCVFRIQHVTTFRRDDKERNQTIERRGRLNRPRAGPHFCGVTVQASDGQSVFLHPLSMKCLLQHYGSYEALPPSLEAPLVEAESVTMATEGTRKKYRYLSHLSLTGAFMLCEVSGTEKRLALKEPVVCAAKAEESRPQSMLDFSEGT